MQPVPGTSRTRSVPPFASTLRRLIERPRPSPLRFVLEWFEQLLGLALGKPATFVPDLDDRTIAHRSCGQRQPAVRSRELHRILQEVRDRRSQHLSVGVDGELFLDRAREHEAFRKCVHDDRDPELADELIDRDRFAPELQAGGQAHVGERSIDEVLKTVQTALEHVPVAPEVATDPLLIAVNASIAVPSWLRSSWARAPNRSFMVAVVASEAS